MTTATEPKPVLRALLGLAVFVVVAALVASGLFFGGLVLLRHALIGATPPEDVATQFGADVRKVAGVRYSTDGQIMSDLMQTSSLDGVVTAYLRSSVSVAREAAIGRTIAKLERADATAGVRLHAELITGSETVGVSENVGDIVPRVRLARTLSKQAGVASVSVLWRETDQSFPDHTNQNLDVRVITGTTSTPTAIYGQALALTAPVSPRATISVSSKPTGGPTSDDVPSAAEPINEIVSPVNHPASAAMLNWLKWVHSQPIVTGYFEAPGQPATITVNETAPPLQVAALFDNPPPNETRVGKPTINAPGDPGGL